MPPKPAPKDAKPALSAVERKAQEATSEIKDTEKATFLQQLQKECTILKDTFDDEERLTAQYQLEREKINYNWIISKKELEDQKSLLINKEREIQDLRENHTMTINVLKQKIKHLLFQNQDQQSELKKDVEVTLKQLEDEHRIQERELKTDNRALKVQTKEQECSHYDYVFAIQAEFDKQSTLLRQEYERQANDIKRKYDLKMYQVRQMMEEARNSIIKQLEEQKDGEKCIKTKLHGKKYNDIKNYYSDITATNLDMIKQLKNEINDHTKSEDRDKKMLQQIERENKELTDPLKATRIEINELMNESQEQDRVKDQKEKLKIKIEESGIFLRKLEYEYEVKLQDFTYIDRERESLQEKFNQTIYQIHQKIGLENLILEKKVTNIKEDLEIKDLQLNQTIQVANLDPKIQGQLTQSLEEVETLKNELINELQQQLKQIRKAHSLMVKAYEGKLSEFVIPVEELGFDPLVPTNTD